MIRLETARLVLRAPVFDDQDAYLDLNNDPRVTRYVAATLSPEPEGIES